MDLSALGSTLPPGLADAERDMGDKFRAAALSITNLYKSSLGYTKQAYHVGYAAALADVLSTVQSSIGAGQDAEQTLSRLMDWADARQAAINAFATEDEADVPPSSSAKRPNPLSRPSLSHLTHAQAHPRASSAPVPDPTSFRNTTRHDNVKEKGKEEEKGMIYGTSTVPLHNTASTSNSTPNTSIESTYQPTPPAIISTSSSPSGSPISRQIVGSKAKNVPLRFPHQSQAQIPSRPEANGSFNPAIAISGVPFVSFTDGNSNSIGGMVPGQNYPVGSKRPLVDTNMEVEESTTTTTTTAAAVPQSQSTTQRERGRTAKRRSLGLGLANKNNDEDNDGRRRGGKRHGHGAGAGAGAGAA